MHNECEKKKLKSKQPSRLIKKEHSYSLTPKAKTIQVLV